MPRLALIVAILVGAGAPAQTDPRALLTSADRLREESTRVSLDASIEAYAKAAAAARSAGVRDVEARALLGQGIALSLLARNAEAAPPLDQAEPIFAAIGDRSGLAETRLYRASLRDRPDEREEIITIYRAAIALAREAGDRRVEGVGLDFLGWAGDLPNVLTLDEKRAALAEAVAIRRTLPSRWDLATSLCSLAYFTPNRDDGKRILEEALTVAESARALRPMGFALSLLAGHQSEYEQALDYYNRAQALNRESGNRRQEAYSYESAAHLHYYRGYLRESLGYFRQALDAHRALNNPEPEGYLHQSLGTVLRSLGELEEAQKHLEQALAITRERRDRTSEGLTLLAMSAARQDSGDALGGLELASSALSAFREVGAEDRQISAYMWIGGASETLGRYREAIEAYRTGREIAARLGDRLQVSLADRWLGTVFAMIGDVPRAIEHLTSARELGVKVGNNDTAAVALSHLASLRLTLGEPDTAKALLDDALTLAKQTQRAIVEARVLDAQARHAIAIGRPEEGLALLGLSAERKRRAGEADDAYHLLETARAHVVAGNRAAAMDALRRSLAESRTMRLLAAESMALTELMNLSRAAGDPAAAVFYGKQAVNMFQATRANLRQLDLATQRIYVEARAHVYRDLADMLIESGRLPEAQQVLNLLKEQEFFDFIRRDSGSGAVAGEAAMTAREAAVLAGYSRNAARLAEIGQARGEILSWRTRTPEQERELDDLEAKLRVASADFTEFLEALAAELSKDARGAVQIAEIGNSKALMEDLRDLKHQSVALYTVVHSERYRVILVTPDVRVDAYYPITAAALNRKVLAFRQALEDPRSNPQPLAQELYEILVAPIAPALEKAKAGTLMWVLDGTLRYLPVAALHDGRGYLAERYLNAVFTPASHARLKDEPSRRWTGLGAGVSKPHGEFSPLPAVTEELNGIFRSSAGSATGVLDGQVLLDEAFTADAFRRSLRQRRPLVHVATHFQFRPGNETDSFLLLGDGSRLTLAEMRQQSGLFGGVELLTLSACNTAVGDAGATGTEVEGAGILAQNNGAKAVIASLWSVSDASTRVFMQEFYRARSRRGATKASALRDAQVALLRGGAAAATTDRRGLKPAAPSPARASQYSHPYFWAPFILIGNWK